MKRKDNRLWAMPGGLIEVGESPAQAAVRELWEEAGVRGRIVRLLGIFDSRLWPGGSPYQLCILQFQIETNETPFIHDQGSAEMSPLTETLAVDYFDPEHLPEMHGGHGLRVPMAFKLARGEIKAPYFDQAPLYIP